MTGLPAPYAAKSGPGGGREVGEPPPSGRSQFQRDRDRVLHAQAFRRLAQKTQVMLPDEGDHHRTRLTHSLEVAQIARSLARSLGFDEDLTEALALAHDLGHTPFGHTGEDALEAVMAPFGGFDHNVQSLRIVVDLEQHYLDFDGLNLTWDTLEGLAKRNGPIAEPTPLLAHYDARLGLGLDRFASGEAQIAAVADDIAYNAHDLEDGLRAGLLQLDAAREVPVVGEVLRLCTAGRTELDPSRLPYALARRLIDLFVRDTIAETGNRLAAAAPADAAAIRALGVPVVGLSAPLLAASRDLKTFLFAHMYRHPRLVAMRARAATIVADLASRFLVAPDLMPGDWGARAHLPGADVGRLVSDYVAGMTDRYAVHEHRRLFDVTPEFR